MTSNLTKKQHAFIAEYLKTGNGTEAARRAGYKGNDITLATVAKENLRKPPILEACSKAQEARNKRLELEEDYELRKAVEILDRCMDPMMFDSKGANSALQTIAKLRGKFVSRVQVSLADGYSEALESVDI